MQLNHTNKYFIRGTPFNLSHSRFIYLDASFAK